MASSHLFITLASGICLLCSISAFARDSLFNPRLLELDHPADNIDIHQFNRSNTLPAEHTKLM